MAWYKTGTISVTNGAAVVYGAGTAWVDSGVLNAGDIISINGVLYEILSIQSNTQLTLASNYLGVGAAGLSYAIMPIGLLPSALAQQVKATLATANAALAAAVRSDVQNLTAAQQQTARNNIAALGAADVGAGRLVKSVAGGVDVVLTAAEAANQFLEFTGTLTANISVIVPPTVRLYYVVNNTSGAFTLTVKPAGGAGVSVVQGKTQPLYCGGGVVRVAGEDAVALAAQVAGAFPRSGGTVTGPVTVQGTVEATALAWSAQRFTVSSGQSVPLYGVSWSDFSAGTIGSSAVVSGWGGVRLYSAGQPRIVVSHGGDVGIGTGSPNGTLELRRDDINGPSLVLNSRYMSGSVHKFGSILFGARRDVSDPSFPAGIWAEGTDAIGNYADLVLGAAVNGSSGHPTERLRLYGAGGVAVTDPFKPGQYTLATLPASSAYNGFIITVSNAAGGPALCLSTGTNWINLRTNAPVN